MLATLTSRVVDFYKGRSGGFMNNLEYTKEYYSIWLDISSAELGQKGVTLIKTDKRKICPDGYPRNLDIYCVCFQDSLFISYNPDLDDESHFVDYEIPYTDRKGVLDVLQYIFQNIDSTLAFRWKRERSTVS